MNDSPYRSLPGVDTLVEDPSLQSLDLGQELLVEAARAAIEEARETIRQGQIAPDTSTIVATAVALARRWTLPSLVGVINATGVILHTNLGRAPLAVESLGPGLGTCNLEYDLEKGERGSRRQHVENLLTTLSGAESALVVNNGAAALVLILTTLTKDREVIISRGELVEIGGSFRIPDVMETSGAHLREVGTTNRTYVKDYAAAIDDNTGAILTVWPSNFRITGFVHKPKVNELAELAHSHGLPFICDVGSGTFAPLPPDLDQGDSPKEILQQGADLICFSADKLLGGPQAGIIVGKSEFIERLALHPMMRALRVDKVRLSLLESTLRAYRTQQCEQVPVWRMLHTSLDTLDDRIAAAMAALATIAADLQCVPCLDTLGGGSHPGETLPGLALCLKPSHGSVQALANRLRTLSQPIVAVIEDDTLNFHFRTIPADMDGALIEGIKASIKTD